jgi:hypothetical protein
VLRLLAGRLPVSTPAATTVLNWCCRLGLAVLERAVPRRDDMTVLAVEATAGSTGAWVAGKLEEVSARTGVPVQIVGDHGSHLRKGVALFRQQAPGCVETCDISHAVAAQLKAHWRGDACWQGLLQQAGTTFGRFQQTDLALLLPPRQRTKARCMAVDGHVDWAQRMIACHDRRDFSAIGRPCVFSAEARAHLRARWGRRRVEPLRPLIGCRYDGRGDLCEALRAWGATGLDEPLDAAFRRLADRGHARFLEAFDWVLTHRDVAARAGADDRRVQDRPDGAQDPRAVAHGTGGGAGGRVAHAGPPERRARSGRASRRCRPTGVLGASRHVHARTPQASPAA